MRQPYRTISLREIRDMTIADLRALSQIGLIHDYSRMREGVHSSSEKPLAVILPYQMFMAWQDLFHAANKSAQALSKAFAESGIQ